MTLLVPVQCGGCKVAGYVMECPECGWLTGEPLTECRAYCVGEPETGAAGGGAPAPERPPEPG